MPPLRRAHREAPLVLLGADALTVVARPGAAHAGPGWSWWRAGSCRPTDWARAVEVGAERVAVLPADEAGC